MIFRHARDSDAEQFEFSRNVVPEADETQLPDDDPYVSVALAL